MRPSDAAFAVVWVYLGAALTGKLIYSDILGKPLVAAAVYAVVFLLTVMASYVLWGKSNSMIRWREALYLGLTLLFLIPLGPVYFLAGIPAMGLAIWLLRKAVFLGRARRIGITGGGIAVALFSIGIVTFGVPLMKPWLRYTVASVPFLAAGDVLIIAIGAYPSPWLMLLGLVIAIVGASRTVGIGVLTAYILAEAYGGISLRALVKKKSLLILTIFLFAAMLLARYWVTRHLYPDWSLGLIGTLFYRVGSTYTVYEHLFEWGMPFGNHILLFQSDPTGYVGHLFGRDVGYTYSLFGQPAYDFGIIGIVEAVFLGVLLREADRSAVTGTFAFTLLVLMTEIGIEGAFLSALSYAAFLGIKFDVGDAGWRKR